MGLGKTYSTKYLLDSNNSSGVAGQVLSTTSTGIDWVDANTVPGTGLWLASGNNIYNSNSGNVGIGTTSPGTKLHIAETGTISPALFIDTARYGASIIGDGTSNSQYLLNLQSNGGSTDVMRVQSSGNVGIGTTSPSQKLEVDGAVKVTNTFTGETSANSGYFDFASTTSTARITTKGSDGSTLGKFQILQQASDGSPNNTPFYIDSDSNVGIGTTSPSTKLHVIGQDATFYSNTGDQSLQVGRNANERLELYVNDSMGKITAIQDSDNNGPHNFILNRIFAGTGSNDFLIQKDGSTQLAINTNGNVGIGTTSPGSKLEVNSGGSDSVARFTSTDARARILISDNNDISYFGTYIGTTFLGPDDTPSGNTINVLSNGNVGIGTTSPGAKLEISKSRDTTFIITSSYNGGWANQNYGHIEFKSEDLSGTTDPRAAITGLQFSNGAYGGLGFSTHGLSGSLAEAMRIDSSGNVGIGTTSPDVPLEVIDKSFSAPAIRITALGSTEQAELQLNRVGDNRAAQITYALNGSDEWYSGIIRDGGTTITGYSISTEADANVTPPQFHILANGNVGIGTTSPSQKLEVDGQVLSDGYRLATMQTAPATRNSTGTLGEIVIDGNHIYVCYATDSWSRVALDTSW